MTMTKAPNARIIVVGIDYSGTSDLALNRAFELATAEPDIELHAVHVADVPGTPSAENFGPLNAEQSARLTKHVSTKLLEFLEQHAGRKPPRRVLCHIRGNEAAHEIAQLAADLEADLVVVGTHGRRAAARLLMGSVAEVAVRLAPCPVLVVRPKALGAPVPRIEPPCPRCVQARKDSGGAQWWCEQHLERHGQRHTYHQGDRVSSDSMFPLVFRS
jgi:nucleotide-binding universal stress UspA family protein